MSEPFSESDPFEVLVDEYLDRYRRGERPSLTEFAAAHPEHAVRLRSLVPAMLVMEEFGPGSDVSAHFGRPESLARMPERLGDYRLIRPIGSGGMGVVYEAIQESLGRHVALKTIPSHQPEDATRLERFRHEAHAAARLHHAHIVPVFGIGEHDGLHFYTMQFIQGHGLDLILREVCRLGREPSAGDVANGAPGGRDLSNGLARDLRDGRFLPQSPAGGASASEPRAPLLTARSTRSGEHHPTEARYLHSVAWIGVQVADALEYAHRQGVLHRDIKPSNLLLDAQGHVWVTDFGLAKTQDRDELTRTGDVVGTLRYMAPERFSGWSDPRSDIFALGATLYELLTFRPAFDEPDRVRLVDRLLHGSPPPLRQLDRRFPRDLETIVLKALANTSGERYATAGLLAEDLRRFVAGRPIVARRSHVIERVWRWSRRNPAGAAAAATVAATLTAAVAMSIIYAREQRWAALEVQALAVDLAKERQSLQASLTESRRILALRDFDRAQAAFEKDQGGSGLLWLMESWRYALGARDSAWQHLARANLSAWSVRLPRLTGLLSHEDPIDAAVFSPDGTTILTGSDDFSARFWSADTSQPIGPTLHHPATVYAVALSPDGKTALTGCGDGVARLWDAASGRLAAPPLLHADRVASVAFSPDGKTVLTGSNDGTARLWNATTGLPIGRPLAYGGPITAVAFNPVGNLVAAASRDGTILFWNAADGTLMHFPLMRAGPVLALAFAPNGLTIFTAMEGGSAQIWGVTTGRPIVTELNRHRGHVRSVAVSPDGRTYVTGSEDKTARLWDASTHQPLGPPLIHQGPVVAVAFRADGKSLLTASSDHTVRVWDAESCRHPQPTLERAGAGRAVAFRPDSESFVGANWDGTTRLWNIAAGLPAGPVMHSQSLVLGIACSPDGKTLVAGGVPARLWDIATGRPLGRHLAHPGGARVVAFSPKGDIVVTGGADQTIRIWDGETGAPLSAPTSHTGEIDAVAFSPNGKTLVAGYDSGNARIWDVTAVRPIGPVLRHPGAVSAVAFSPDGETIATGCEDGMARLWDVRTGDLRVPPLPHQAWVFAVAFSPDGKTVLTGSRDRTARLWDAAVGQPIGPPFSHNTEVWAVAFAPDGQSILTGDISSTARVFALPSALPDDPEQVGAWIELLTGLRLDATRGSLLTVDNTTWRATRDRLKRLAAEPRIGAGARLDIRGVPPSTGVAGKAAP